MASRSLGKLTLQIMAETGQFKRALTDAEKAVEALTNKQKRQEKQVDRLISAIDPLAGEYQKLDKQLVQLQQHHKDGLIDASRFDYYKTKLAETRKALDSNRDSMDGNGQSAKQMQWAMRGLPAQFTDIAVSLQGGQNPMTVFLQQGGQIKDMFGGFGPAAKAMGTYIAGLVNPLSIAAVGVATLGLAYYQGSKEIDAFNNAIIMNGNVAGVSANQLIDAAARIDRYTGTHAQAAKALALVAESGKFTGIQLEQVAATAVLMENTTGKAIGDTINEFEKLAQDPAKAVAELNDKYHFLTASVYEQIAALVEEGKQTDAANLAMQSYGDALAQRTSEITNNLGLIETAWKAIKLGAAETWDDVLSVGRTDSLEQQYQDFSKRIEELTPQAQIGEWGYGFAKKELEALYVKRDAIMEQMKAERDRTEQQKQQAEINQKSIQSQQAFNTLLDSTLTKEEKRTKAYKDLDKYIANIRKANPDSALISDANIAKIKQSIDEQFADKKGSSTKDSEASRLLLRYQQQHAVLQQQLNSNEKLGTSAKALLELNEKISAIKNKDILTADDKSLLANEKALRTELEKNKALEEQINKRNQLQKMQAYIANFDTKAASARQQQGDQLQHYGKGNTELQRLAATQQIEREVQGLQGRSLQSYIKGDLSDEEYQQQLTALNGYLNQRLTDQQAYYDKLDEMRGDWQNGAKSAYANYIDSAKDVAGQTENLFNNAFNSMEDAIVQFALTGKASFSDFATAILADLARIAARQAIVQMLSSVVGSYSSGGVVGGTISESTFTTSSSTKQLHTGGYTGAGGKYQPAGIVHKGEVVFSQEDVARHGGVASVERLRKGFKGFADGGVVGGGYAASVPSTGSGSSGINITQHIKIDNGNSESMGDSDKLGKAYAKAADEGTRKEIAKQLKPGGMIWAAMRGY